MKLLSAWSFLVLRSLLGCSSVLWGWKENGIVGLRRCFQDVLSIPCPPPQGPWCAWCSCWGWHPSSSWSSWGCFHMLYCSLYSHQFPAQVLKIAPKPPPPPADIKGLSLLPSDCHGPSDFPHISRGRPGNNCLTTWQLLKPAQVNPSQLLRPCAARLVQSLWPFTCNGKNHIY